MDNIVNNVPHIKRKGGISPAIPLVKAAISFLFLYRYAFLIEHRLKLVAYLTHVDGRTKFVHLYDDGFLYHDIAVIVLVNAFSACKRCTVYTIVDEDTIDDVVRGQRFDDLGLGVLIIEADEEAVFGGHGLPFACRLPDKRMIS